MRSSDNNKAELSISMLFCNPTPKTHQTIEIKYGVCACEHSLLPAYWVVVLQGVQELAPWPEKVSRGQGSHVEEPGT